MMNATRIKPEEARAKVLAELRLHNYKGLTSELAQWTGLPSSVVRRAGLYLGVRKKVVAILVPGRGKGEYLFHLQQLDLFDDHQSPSFWRRVRKWFQ